MFASIVRGVHAFRVLEFPLQELSPNTITLTEGLIPKINSSQFNPFYQSDNESPYIKNETGLKDDEIIWNLSLILQDLLRQRLIICEDREMKVCNLINTWGS